MITLTPYDAIEWGDRIAIFCSSPERKYHLWAAIDTSPQFTASRQQIDDCQAFRFELKEDSVPILSADLNRPIDDDPHTALRLFIAMHAPDLLMHGFILEGSYQHWGKTWDINAKDFDDEFDLPDGFTS